MLPTQQIKYLVFLIPGQLTVRPIPQVEPILM